MSDATREPAARYARALELLDPDPDDRVVEIGCGHGIALGLVAERLDGGHVVGVDRSPTMIEMAGRRNRAHVAAGRMTLVVAEVDGLELPGPPLDAAFAIRVGRLVRPGAGPALAAVRGVLAPAGRLVVVHDAPAPDGAAALAEGIAANLAAHGFAVRRVLTDPVAGVAAVGVEAVVVHSARG